MLSTANVSSGRREEALPASARPEGTWSSVLGSTWWLDLIVFSTLIAAIAFSMPLHDPDLPMHLSVGEWIVSNGTVPRVEVFAWTREGEPYYAYSWLPQTIYYLIYDAFGPVGLRVLQALLLPATAGVILWCGQLLQLRPATTLAIAGINLLMAVLIAPALRPQMVLLITVPIIWALLWHTLQEGELRRRRWFVILILSAITANSHLFFALTAAPLGLCLTRAPIAWRRTLTLGLAIGGGWLLSPYGLEWPRIFRHNFGENPLMSWPPIITELIPGFVGALTTNVQVLPIVALFALLPWLLQGSVLAPRERLLFASFWLAGLLVFGYASRMLMVWWLLIIVPFVFMLERQLGGGTHSAPPRLLYKLPLYGLFLSAAVVFSFSSAAARSLEGPRESRRLSTVNAQPAEVLASWLEQNALVQHEARLLTSFNYGSYLTWRIPGISASVDSRGMFPDSILAAEAYVPAGRRDVPLGPWRDAQLAILPLGKRVAAVLDTADGWYRMADARGAKPGADSLALWVQKEWWQSHGLRPLPDQPVQLIFD